MKKLLALFILAGFLTSGCTVFENTPFQGTFLDNFFTSIEKKVATAKTPDKPEKVLEKFLSLMQDKKYKKALKLFSKDYQTDTHLKILENNYTISYKSLKIIEEEIDPNGNTKIYFQLDEQSYWAAVFTNVDGLWKLIEVITNPYD